MVGHPKLGASGLNRVFIVLNRTPALEDSLYPGGIELEWL